MAAKKKPTKRRRSTTVSGMKRRSYSRSRSRSKMGALPVSVELIGGSIAGAIANRVIMANMSGPVNPRDTDVRPYVWIALGLGLMYVGKGNKVMEGAALGSIGDSVANMISAMYIPQFGNPNGIGGFKANTIGGNSQGFQNNVIGAGHHRMLQGGNGKMGNKRRRQLALNGINGNNDRMGYDGC